MHIWRGHFASEQDTQTFAQRLALCPAMGYATLALHGDLGAGKTTLVRHLLRALGVQGRIKSPTYAVVEPHHSLACPWPQAQDTMQVNPLSAVLNCGETDGASLNIWHFDFYRFNDPREWEDAGFRELFASPGLKLVEWPERAAGLMPHADADISLAIDNIAPTPTDARTLNPFPDAARFVQLQAHTAVGAALLAAVCA